MKQTLLCFVALSMLAACSAPKYTYNFDYYNYNAGKKKAGGDKEVMASQVVGSVNPQALTASLESSPMIVENQPSVIASETSEPVKKTYLQMTKVERKALRQHIKSEIKSITKSKKTEIVQGTTSTQKMDRDLMMASVFGAVGIVGLIIGGDVFYIIGGIALLIGVVFFVKWIVRQ